MRSRVLLVLILCTLTIATNRLGNTHLLSESDRDYLPTQTERLRRLVNVQNWDDGGDLSHFVYLHTSEVFPTAIIGRNGPVSPLEEAPNPKVAAHLVTAENGRKVPLSEYINTDSRIDGFIVLHHGRVVYEAYPRMRREDKHLLMSTTKAFIGTAVGILEDQGKVDIHRPISNYIAALKGTGWEGIAVRDILEMASGMEGENESYTDPANKHYQYEASLGLQPKTLDMPESVRSEDTYRFLASLKRLRNPGETWAYASVNTAMLGWLVEQITGKNLANFLSDEIWARVGAEADAQIVVSNKGIPVAHAGMTTTLRDLARFGLLFTPSWHTTTQTPIISEKFLRRILTDGRTELVKSWNGGPRPDWLDHVAYQWDAVTKRGNFMKGGFGGQLLFVSPQKDVIIAYFGTNRSLDDAFPVLDLGDLLDLF